MTLTELANFICTKLSDTDAASVTACKSYINRRYQMIWDSALWTETLGIVTQPTLAAETETVLSTAPSITFYQSASAPTTFADFAVAAKFTRTGNDDGYEMIGQDWISFFQIDPNMWNDVANRRANPFNFINLPKNGSGYARLNLVPVPDVAGSVYVLANLEWVTLGDNDSPCLRGIDNALLAFAEGDMLERARKYAQAQVKYTESAAQVEVMRSIETGQQQKNFSIIPCDIGDNSLMDIP